MGKMNRKSKKKPVQLQAVCKDDAPELPSQYNDACDEAGLPYQDTLKQLARWFIGLSPEDRQEFFLGSVYPLTPAGRVVYNYYHKLHREVLSAGLVAFKDLGPDDQQKALREATGQAEPSGIPHDMVVQTVRQELESFLNRPETARRWLELARSAGLPPAEGSGDSPSSRGGEESR